MIRIVIVDDHKIVRDGLKSVFMHSANEISIIGEAASGQQAISLLEETEVDVVLMDINMPEMNGIEATRIIKEKFPNVKVLLLTMMDNEKFVWDATQAGAHGYVLKTAGHKELLHAIRIVMEGEQYFSTDIAKMLLHKLQPRTPSKNPTVATHPTVAASKATQSLPANISAREMEVLHLISKGHTNEEIGEILFTSKRTVETHRQNLLEKTGAKNTATLIRHAFSQGWIE